MAAGDGAKVKVIRQGDSVESVAYQAGLFGATLWMDSGNTTLRACRVNRNALLPGDRLVVPAKRPKSAEGGTGQEHVFRRKGVPAKLHLAFLGTEGKPLAERPFEAHIDGRLESGTTDGDGEIVLSISPDAKLCRLFLGEDRQEYRFHLGHMDPIEETSGIQGRLANLGYQCGIDGGLDSATRAAIAEFQRGHGLAETGQADDATRAALESAHGS